MSSISLGTTVISRRNWKQWLCITKMHYGLCVNSELLREAFKLASSNEFNLPRVRKSNELKVHWLMTGSFGWLIDCLIDRLMYGLIDWPNSVLLPLLLTGRYMIISGIKLSWNLTQPSRKLCQWSMLLLTMSLAGVQTSSKTSSLN